RGLLAQVAKREVRRQATGAQGEHEHEPGSQFSHRCQHSFRMMALEEIVMVLLPPTQLRRAPTHPIRYWVATLTVISAPEAPEPAILQALILETGVTVIVVGGSVVRRFDSARRALILAMMGAAL